MRYTSHRGPLLPVAAICGLFGRGKVLSFVKESATVTPKGQITLPKAVRQALDVDAGDKVVFELREDGQVVVTRWEANTQTLRSAPFWIFWDRTFERVAGCVDCLMTWSARCWPTLAAACSHELIEGEVAL